jgi:hypothetical protein
MKIINGTHYKSETPDAVISILEQARTSRWRLRMHYGDRETGRAWGDVTTGYIGRSTGPVKIPLAIRDSRCLGGSGILDHCIIRIEHANKKLGGMIWQSANAHWAG